MRILSIGRPSQISARSAFAVGYRDSGTAGMVSRSIRQRVGPPPSLIPDPEKVLRVGDSPINFATDCVVFGKCDFDIAWRTEDCRGSILRWAGRPCRPSEPYLRIANARCPQYGSAPSIDMGGKCVCVSFYIGSNSALFDLAKSGSETAIVAIITSGFVGNFRQERYYAFVRRSAF